MAILWFKGRRRVICPEGGTGNPLKLKQAPILLGGQWFPKTKDTQKASGPRGLMIPWLIWVSFFGKPPRLVVVAFGFLFKPPNSGVLFKRDTRHLFDLFTNESLLGLGPPARCAFTNFVGRGFPSIDYRNKFELAGLPRPDPEALDTWPWKKGNPFLGRPFKWGSHQKKRNKGATEQLSQSIWSLWARNTLELQQRREHRLDSRMRRVQWFPVQSSPGLPEPSETLGGC